jgi:hypothetical protein
MADKFKFEIAIIVCACFASIICNELVTAESLSTTLLLGGTVGIPLLLFMMAFFTTTSIHGISEDKKTRKEVKVFYIYMSVVSLVTMLLLIVFGAEPIFFWVVVCILWYLASSVRIAILWDWL